MDLFSWLKTDSTKNAHAARRKLDEVRRAIKDQTESIEKAMMQNNKKESE